VQIVEFRQCYIAGIVDQVPQHGWVGTSLALRVGIVG
jgi:hypothetical protein